MAGTVMVGTVMVGTVMAGGAMVATRVVMVSAPAYDHGIKVSDQGVKASAASSPHGLIPTHTY